jgi:hypothetical protein
MSLCNQTVNQTVLEHGYSVHNWFNKIINKDVDLKIPDWLNLDEIIPHLYPFDIIKTYQIYHDCGKPFCKTVDEQGSHFKDHAQISSEIYFELTGDQLVSNLIRWDMFLHTCTSLELESQLSNFPKAFWYTLILTALAELHSNAQMFGGIQSDSFKMKWKKWNQRSRQIFKFYESISNNFS